MSQDEILRLLEKRKKPMNIKQIAEKLSKGTSSIGNCMRKLRNSKDVKYKFDKQGRYLYWV